VIGALPPAITIGKTNKQYSSLIPISGSDIDTEYEISFTASGGVTNPYSATLKDTLTVTCPSGNTSCGSSVWIMGSPVLVDVLGNQTNPTFAVDATKRVLTVNLVNLVPPLEYKLKVKVHIEGSDTDGDGIPSAPSNTKLSKWAVFDVSRSG